MVVYMDSKRQRQAKYDNAFAEIQKRLQRLPGTEAAALAVYIAQAISAAAAGADIHKPTHH